jgi:hypothetical protein
MSACLLVLLISRLNGRLVGGIIVATVAVLGALVFYAFQVRAFGPPSVGYPATFRIEARYDPGQAKWLLRERFILTDDASNAIGVMPTSSLLESGDPEPESVVKSTSELAAEFLAQAGWRSAGGVVGAPEFERAVDRSADGAIPLYPVRSSHRIPVDDVFVNGVQISPNGDSKVVLSYPSGMVYSTTPASDATLSVDGDVRTISIEGDFRGSGFVDVEALSPIVRNPLLATIVHTAHQGWMDYILGALTALLVGAAGKQLLAWPSRKDSAAPATSAGGSPPPHGSVTSTRQPRERRRRRVAGRRR